MDHLLRSRASPENSSCQSSFHCSAGEVRKVAPSSVGGASEVKGAVVGAVIAGCAPAGEAAPTITQRTIAKVRIRSPYFASVGPGSPPAQVARQRIVVRPAVHSIGSQA